MTTTNGSEKPTIVSNRLAVAITGAMLAIASAAWVTTYYLMPFIMMNDQSSSSSMTSLSIAALVSFPSPFSISIFETAWIIGMVAMMFPAMIPFVLFYNKIVTRHWHNSFYTRILGTSLFLMGYLVVYAALGISAYLAVYETIGLSSKISNLAYLSGMATAALLIVTGIYQFTTLKSRCLTNCISPISFFAVHYKEGLVGSMRMGVTHGIYCVGCCWVFMLVMLGVGEMSIPVMAILASVIALEKVLARGALWFNRIVGTAFISAGTLVLFLPNIFLWLHF